MGDANSWMAFKGITKEEALSRVGLRDTGEADQMCESDTCGARLGDGWYLIFANDEMFVLEHDENELSSGCRLVTFQVMEIVMTCMASCYENVEPVWEISYLGNGKLDDLSVEGSPPDGFAAIRDRYVREQEESAPGSLVDHIFEIPVETAKLVCGYRYDVTMFRWGRPSFTRLEPL